MSGPAADSEKPSDASHRWRRTRARASVAIVRFCVKSSQGAEESEVLFTLIAERYERRSLGITSNLVFSEWERIFANPMATAAAIDRVVHHSVILEFDVPSYRTNAAQQRGQAKEVNRQN